MTQVQRTPSRHYRVLLAVAAVLRDSPLGSVDGEANVFVRRLPFKRTLAYVSGIYVTPTPETITGRDSAADWIGYGAAITEVSAPTAQDLTEEESLNDHLLIRERLYDVLLPMTDRALPGCDFISQVQIEPGAIFDLQGFAAGYDVQQLIARCSGYKLRGTQYGS